VARSTFHIDEDQEKWEGIISYTRHVLGVTDALGNCNIATIIKKAIK
jgi:hypothetical protein